MIEVPSAFTKDNERREQQEAKQRLDNSIPLQDEKGNLLHGHARTEVARDLREEMKEAARDDRAGLPNEEKRERKEEREARRRGDTVRVAINTPHRAQVRGNQIALTIRTPAAVGGGDTTTIPVGPWQPIPAATANKVIVEPFAQLLDTNFTAYSITNFSSEFTLTQTNYLLYLELDYTVGVLASVTLKRGAEADWTGWPNPVETSGTGTLGDPYIVEKTRFLIAYAKLASNTGVPAGCMNVTESGTALKVIRCVFTPLSLAIITLDGLTFEYPVPGTRIV